MQPQPHHLIWNVVVDPAGRLCSLQPRQPFLLVSACELQVRHAAAKVLQPREGRGLRQLGMVHLAGS